MSSTVSQTEVKTIPPKVIAKLKMEEKPAKLVRTSSIDKIKRFNTYICSQHYYVLPSLLNWLKSSQTVLQSSTEKTIFFFRSLIFNTFFYKIFQLVFKTVTSQGVNILNLKPNDFQKGLNILVNTCCESTILFHLVIYFAVFSVVSQLAICIYLLSLVHVPAGLIFLLVAFAYISVLNYQSFSSSFLEKKNSKRDIKNK